MKSLVTGVAGFVGSSIAAKLLAEGQEVVGVDCFTDYYARGLKDHNLARLKEHPTFSFHQRDLGSDEIADLVSDVSVVYHQAAQAGVRASWGGTFKSYTHHNILATQRLLESCAGKENISRVVYASSSSVYGNAESYPTLESALPRPVSPYGVSKLAAEHLMHLYHSEFGVPTISLRYFTVFGPRQRPDMAFNRWIRQALRKQELTLYGDGTQSRDFTFIDDIVDANIAASKKGTLGQAYNLGGGSQATVNDILALLSDAIGDVKIKRSDRQVGDAKHTRADTALAKKELGFDPKVSLKDGILREIEWIDSLLKSDLGALLPTS